MFYLDVILLVLLHFLPLPLFVAEKLFEHSLIAADIQSNPSFLRLALKAAIVEIILVFLILRIPFSEGLLIQETVVFSSGRIELLFLFPSDVFIINLPFRRVP